MKPVRTAARVMLSAIFVSSGVRILLNPDSKVEAARRVTDRVAPMLEKVNPRIPTDPRTLVRVKAASDVVAGLALATGRFSRPAATMLAAGLVPTTFAGHPFWAGDTPQQRAEMQTHFLKNLGMLGGLLLAVLGQPQLLLSITLPISAVVAVVYYASLYFTFADCFVASDGDAAGGALPPPSEIAP